MAITGTGNYKGDVEATFTINPISISAAAVTLSDTSYVYDGSKKKPGVESVVLNGEELVGGTDYTVSYSDNVNAGTALATITGTGVYGGTVTAKFVISPVTMDSSEFKVSLSAYSFEYDGTAKKPGVTVTYNDLTLEEEADYSLAYSSNTEAGEATAIIAGTGNFEGEIEQIFIITQISLSDARVATYAAPYRYTNHAIEPIVVVVANGKRLKENVDYAVVFSDNDDAGIATAIVTGTGNYTDTNAVTFCVYKDTSFIASALYQQSCLTEEMNRTITPGRVWQNFLAPAVTKIKALL